MDIAKKIKEREKNGRFVKQVLRKISSVTEDPKITRISTFKPWKTVFLREEPEKKSLKIIENLCSVNHIVSKHSRGPEPTY